MPIGVEGVIKKEAHWWLGECNALEDEPINHRWKRWMWQSLSYGQHFSFHTEYKNQFLHKTVL